MDVEAAQQIFSAGEHLEQAGKLEQALACYQQATKLYPEHYHYHYKLGNVLLQQEQLESAAESFRKAISLNNHDSWSHYALGEVLTQQQNLTAAIENYQQAISINPDFCWSHYNLARLYQQQNQLESAKACYQEAIRLKSDYFWSHYFLAEILTIFQDREQAIYHYQQVIELNPDFLKAYYPLARHLQQQGKLEAAADYYLRGIELKQSDFNIYYFLGETLVQLTRYTEAIDHCEAAIELQPNNLQAYFLLGLILLNQGDQEIAKYRDTAARQSTIFQVNLELGLAQAWQQQGETVESIKCCQKAIEIDPTAEMPYRILQHIAVENQDIEQGITFYQKISGLRSSSPLLWGNLGDLLTKQSRLTEAIDCYRTSCYQNTVNNYPQLAQLNWQQHKQKAPDFLVIGATKCGTTSLFFYLSQHSQILPPHKKEINFFNHNFEQGLTWYLSHFPAITDDIQYLTGEASPLYIYNDQVRERVKQLFPNTKIIVMLREPVSRTISEYYHAANHGLEQRSLGKIIEQETKRLATKPRGEALDNFGYLLNSIYIDRIEKWLTDFPSENILIIDSGLFFHQTDQVMQQVWEFLDLPAIAPPRNVRYNIGSYSPVNQEINQQLQEFFLPYNQELATYLDRKFSWQ